MKTTDGARRPETPSPSIDGLVGAFGERLAAQFDRASTTLRLALAETRLAASSAALLLGIVLFGAALAFVVWLLLIALLGYGLWVLGLSPAAVLGALLVVHLGAVIALGLIARRLTRDLRFAHTRRALARSGGDTAAEPTGRVTAPKPTGRVTAPKPADRATAPERPPL